MTALITLIHLAAFVGLVALLLAAAVTDLRAFVIPNRLCLAVAALWPAFALSGPGPVAWLAAPAVAVAVFAFGFALFAAGLMGGGDVKLMSALALWAGPHQVLAYLLVTSAVGGALSLALLAGTRLLAFLPVTAPPDVPARRSHFRIDVPYGAAIAVGGLYVAASLAAV